MGYYVSGLLLVADKGAALPDLCLYSGKPTSAKRVTKKFSWAAPGLALLVLVSPLIYIIAYFIVRKTGTLEFSLSEEARSRRTSGIVIALGGTAASFVLFSVAAGTESRAALLGALALMLTALIVGSVRSRVIQVAKIDERHVHLRLRPEAAQAFEADLAR